MTTQRKMASAPKLDFTDPRNIEAFRIAAKAFSGRVLGSAEEGRRILAKEGIYTKSGKLSKHYR